METTLTLKHTLTTDLSAVPGHNDRATDLVMSAQRCEIVDTTTYGRGGDLVREMREAFDKTEAARTKLVKPLNDHVKMINTEFKKITEPLAKAMTRVRGLMTSHSNKVEAVRIAEERELQKKRDAEAIKQAEKLEEAGKPELADAVLEQAASAPVVDARMDTVRGDITGATSSTSKVWKCTILSLKELFMDDDVCAVVEADEQAMNRIRIAVQDYVKLQHKLGKQVLGAEWKQHSQTNVT